MDVYSRSAERFSLYENLHITYEGFASKIPVHVPNLSTHGMFINTGSFLPEGAVLTVSFLLPRTQVQLNLRAEVRYCLPGCGIGLEFIELEQEQEKSIEMELSSRICPYEQCLLTGCDHNMSNELI